MKVVPEEITPLGALIKERAPPFVEDVQLSKLEDSILKFLLVEEYSLTIAKQPPPFAELLKRFLKLQDLTIS